MGNRNFDSELRMKKGLAQYRLDKSKAGRCGSSAGKPRPYAKKNMLKARLNSPIMIGNSITITPRHPFLGFSVGQYYEWTIIEKGVGISRGHELDADQIIEHFIVIPKRRTDETRQQARQKGTD